MRHTCARSLALSMPAQVQLGHVSGSCCCQALVARHQRKAQSQETASRCACRRSDAGKTLTRAWASRGERKTGKLRENSKVMANRNPVMTNRKKGHDNLENPPFSLEESSIVHAPCLPVAFHNGVSLPYCDTVIQINPHPNNSRCHRDDGPSIQMYL